MRFRRKVRVWNCRFYFIDEYYRQRGQAYNSTYHAHMTQPSHTAHHLIYTHTYCSHVTLIQRYTQEEYQV